MIYWVFFIGSLFFSGYQYFVDSHAQYTAADINSAVSYIEHTRVALAKWKEDQPEKEGEIIFEDLSFYPGLKVEKRKDTRFFVNKQGIFIAFRSPPGGLANALDKKYSAANGVSELNWQLGYYHIGFKNSQGCLQPVLNYVEENQAPAACVRPLPDAIGVGDMVFTDEDAQE
jgi:hypothetical protein